MVKNQQTSSEGIRYGDISETHVEMRDWKISGNNVDEFYLEAEDGTYGHELLTIKWPWQNVRIGKYCSISEGITLILGGEHKVSNISTYPFYQFADTWGDDCPVSLFTNGDELVIGNDCWIGHGATILSGVHIGDGSVIGAKSVITKHTLPYSITVGNNRHIGFRFSKKQIARLLVLRWWDWPKEKIKRYIPLLNSNEIDKFLREAENE